MNDGDGGTAPSMAPQSDSCIAIVLAAGEGTRMRSSVPKVLHTILGRSLIRHVLTATETLRATKRIVVVGAGSELVVQEITEYDAEVTTVLQERRGGTGHAVRLALESNPIVNDSIVVVVAGDVPLITGETLQLLAKACQNSEVGAAVLTADVDDPSGYGRVIRDHENGILKIVEDRDATEDEREVHEVNSKIGRAHV